MNLKLRKFVDELPFMEVIKPDRHNKNSDDYIIEMREFRQKLHTDLPPTTLWGYNGLFPGPLFDVKQGRAINVKWENKLPSKHILPIDKSIHHLDSEPEVRTVTHLHGGVTLPDSDGYPEAWYTRDFREVGPYFEREVYHYANNQRALTMWYHDHAMGITRLNVYAGLVGMYILRGKQEERLPLPKGDFEIPLILLDRSFNEDGSLSYPRQPVQDPDSPILPDPSIQPFFIGGTNLVNGKVWPYLEVEPRKYRFRILNAANTRTYELYLDSGDPFYQIGSDGGLLRKTVSLEHLTLIPAERADVIIDFSNHKGKTVHLKNDLGPDADPTDETDDVMQFIVKTTCTSEDHSKIPIHLSNIPSLKSNQITTIRNLKLSSIPDEYDRPVFLLNNKLWSDPVTENPTLNETEIWSFINVTDFPHPIHIHLIQFQVLNRQSFDIDLYNETNKIVFTGPPMPPLSNEYGWKDTVSAPPGQFTRIIVKFSPHTGRYVWHCHILEHEDYDMMRPLDVEEERK